MNRNNWPEGPWTKEQDFYEWADHESGFTCLIIRHSTLGHLCGYISVPRKHPYYLLDYDGLENEFGLSIHGGLTYSGPINEHEWCFGFDCGHVSDLSPGLYMNPLQKLEFEGTYKDLVFVANECRSLARQLIPANILARKIINEF